jgi:circadian clock protein KaiC
MGNTDPRIPQLTKCPTGIQGLDEITLGGLPKSRPTLVCGQAGSGKTLMAMEFLVQGATQFNEPGVYMAFEESTEELTQNVASLGWDLPGLIANRQLKLDYVHIDRAQISETGEYDLEALFIRLGHAIDAIQAKRVVLDTLEVLFAGLTNAAILRSELRRLFQWLKTRGVTAIVTGERGEHSLTRYGLEEYVSDCVIFLDQRINNEMATRRLRIIKYRGTRHSGNEFPFLIEEHGISILPLTSIELNYGVSSDRLPTGVPRLDAMLGGEGFFRGSCILISGTAGSGKTSICSTFAQAVGQRQGRCLYISFEESAQQIIRNMCSIGLDLESLVQKGLLKHYCLRPTVYDLEMHLVKIHQLVNEYNPEAVVVDPISSLDYSGSLRQVKAFLMRLVDFLKTRQITCLFTYLSAEGQDLEVTDFGISSIMDTWLVLRGQETNGERNRLLYLLKSRGMDHSSQVREFQLSNEGIQLVDVYLGAGGVLAGTARLVQEAQEREEALIRQQNIELKRRAIARKQKLLENQIAVLQAEFETEKQELNYLIQQASQREKSLLADRHIRAQHRQADDLKERVDLSMRESNDRGTNHAR